MHYNKIPLISVIIPVWNPGPGISRCIESLRNQTLKEIEMIFVDDYGSDDSMDVVRAAAKADYRIRIIENEENIGAGPSRNKGIEAAQGEYLSFVDPDDYVESDFLELLYAETRKQSFDIVKGSIAGEMIDGSTMENNGGKNEKIRGELSMGMPLFYSFISEHQSAIYKRKLILSTNSRYGLSKRGEDTTFLLQVCAQAKSFSIIDNAYYHYCQRMDGITHEMSASVLLDILQSVHEQVDYVLNKLLGNDAAQKRMENRFLYVLSQFDMFYDDPDYKSVLLDAIEGLRTEWIRLPFHNESERKIFSLHALQEHKCLLPLRPFRSWDSTNTVADYAKLIERWVEFYLKHPEDKKACQKDLVKLLGSAKKILRAHPYSAVDYRQEKRLLKLQFNRLPFSLRMKIFLDTLK